MPCFSPCKGYRSREVNPKTGKHGITFDKSRSIGGIEVTFACGQCTGCRLDRAKQWAIRCVHEAQLHDTNSYITLTYSDDHLPELSSLRLRDFQLFMKRLRKARAPEKVRFFHCGEYGYSGKRGINPHYHAILFGTSFEDLKPWKKNKQGDWLYKSDELEDLWELGSCSAGAVTFQSAAYVARYIMKKVTGEKADDYYDGRTPDYITMSRRPGIGSEWILQFHKDIYPHDYVVIEGRKLKPPRYYDKFIQDNAGPLWDGIKASRKQIGKLNPEDKTKDRLRVREQVLQAKLAMLQPRTMER